MNRGDLYIEKHVFDRFRMIFLQKFTIFAKKLIPILTQII